MSAPLDSLVVLGRAAPRLWRASLICLGLVLTPLAFAQVDLPKPGRGAAPLGTGQPNAAGQQPDPKGNHDSGELVLPKARVKRTDSHPEASSDLPKEYHFDPNAAPGTPAALAAGLLQRLVELPRMDEKESRLIAAQLIALGEDGLRAARAGLALDETVMLVTCARVLAAAGTQLERAMLENRLSVQVPKEVPPVILRALRISAPEWLDYSKLCAYLGHPQSGMRQAAERELRHEVELYRQPTRSTESAAPGSELENSEPAYQADAKPFKALEQALLPVLSSPRSEARGVALELLAELGSAQTRAACFKHLEDPAPKVARRAVDLLASMPAEELVPSLLEKAFGTERLFRDQAYALLTLCELEDRHGQVFVDESRVPTLLANLRSGDPLAVGSAAIALAGIGFRAPLRSSHTWLDLEVPHHLVSALAGTDFHPDIASLSQPARRRLMVLSGEDFGSDGPAWRTWWTEQASAFQARRAVILLDPKDHLRLILLVTPWFASAGGQMPSFALLGPEVEWEQVAAQERFRLSADQAEDLLLSLDQAGVFGAECLPGRYVEGGAGFGLCVNIEAQGKSFVYPVDHLPTWVQHVQAAAQALREANRWQLFLPDLESAAGQTALAAEASYWASTTEPLLREARLAKLVLKGLESIQGVERDRYAFELLRLGNVPGVIVAECFEPLQACLHAEKVFAVRTGALIDVALEAALAVDGPVAAEAAGPERKATLISDLALERARSLFEGVYGQFRDVAQESLGRIVERTGLRLAREFVFDERPSLRAMAAQMLAQSDQANDAALLKRLMGDPDPRVEAAAVEAAGASAREDLRAEILMRARFGDPAVRVAALAGAGKLGGDDALEVLMAAFASEDLSVQRAAVLGLGWLDHADAAPILISLLARDQNSALHTAAAQGLERMGVRAHEQLLFLCEQINHPGRRTAALILSRQNQARALPALIDLLTITPSDADLARELAVLTLKDFRGEVDPASAWWEWSEGAQKDDGLAWLQAAQTRLNLVPTPAGGLLGGGTRSGALSLWRSLFVDDFSLVERARRELSRLLERELESPPVDADSREAWRSSLLAEIEARWQRE